MRLVIVLALIMSATTTHAEPVQLEGGPIREMEWGEATGEWIILFAARECVHAAAVRGWPVRRVEYTYAAELYRKGDYDEALRTYLLYMYAADKDPIDLFNAAQCFRKKGDYALALTFFEAYVARMPAGEDRDRALRLCVQLLAEKHPMTEKDLQRVKDMQKWIQYEDPR